MRPGRSSSERARAWGPGLVVLAASFLLCSTAAAQAPAAPVPPASKNGPPTPEPQAAVCSRCGYRCDAGWRYCPNCGWDLSLLAGEAAGRRLLEVEQGVMGLVVVKPKIYASDLMPPHLVKLLKRYRLLGETSGGQRKAFATAFAFGRPGIFLTSARTLERGVEAQLRSLTNQTYSAEILGYDIPSGVGVLKADALSLAPLRPAPKGPDASDGAWVVCSPVTFEEQLVRFLPISLHHGRVTDVGQTGTALVSLENLLRSDHTIPSGCDGGPLIDQRGAASGMVLGGPAPGITYSAPLSDLLPIVEVLAQERRLERPYFGMGLAYPDERRKAKFGLGADVSRPVVTYLIPGSPSESAGVRPGDLLVAVRGEKVATIPEAGAALLHATPGGGAVALTVERAGQEVTVPVQPTARPERILLAPADEMEEALEANLVEVTTGPTSEQGLRVSHLLRGGRGEDVGFKDGDIIRGVDGKSLRRFETFNDIVRAENPQVFGAPRGAPLDRQAVSLYVLRLDVRSASGGKEGRVYSNLFPELLAPPVY